MKQSSSFLKRCLALALAVVLLVSSANLGLALKALAADDSESITVGEVVANNYDLSDAEEALLKSGYLVGGSITYTAPVDEDNLVTIDTENSKIVAADAGEWEAVSAEILVDGESVATIEITDGEGTYDPAVTGEIFSVEVSYELNKEIDVATQKALLNAAAYLQQGVANADAVYAADSDIGLGVVAEAIDVLVQLANTDGGFTSQEAIDAVGALEGEIHANNGSLTLQLMNAAYEASASKIQYLVANGADYKAQVVSTYANLKAIASDARVTNGTIDTYLEGSDKVNGTNNATIWKTFKGILNRLVEALEAPASDAWNMVSTVVVADGLTVAQYAELDKLVAAVEVAAAPAVVNPLLVASTSVKANVNMIDLTVTLNLSVMAGVPDAYEYVTHTYEEVLTLPEGTTEEEAYAAIEIVKAAAIAEWTEKGLWVEGMFETVDGGHSWNGSLTEDADWNETYGPADVQVAIEWNKDVTALPYGYKMTLPAHEDSANKAYDYTVNGEYYVQGSVVTIAGETVMSRKEVKAYSTTTLYAAIANSFGNDIAQAILSAGALKGDETISYHEPESTEAADLLWLENDVLTADATYASDYLGKQWVPYSYGANGSENLFDGNTATWTDKSVKVRYALKLDNVSVDKVAEVLELVTELKAEADSQKNAMDRLLGYYDDIGTLNKNYLAALKGTISEFDFTPNDGADGFDDPTDAKNVELVNYFYDLVSKIQANCLDRNGNLTIYNMLTEYQKDGMVYYYKNADAVISQVAQLSSYLIGLVADTEKQAALETLLGPAPGLNMPQYVEKISKLGTAMSEINEGLVATNEAIDLESANLNKLVAALTVTGDVQTKAAATPYILSDVLTALDQSQVMLQAVVVIDGVKQTVTTESVDRRSTVTEEMVKELQEKIDAIVATLDDKVYYYTCVTEGKVEVGTVMEDTITVTYTYTAKEYTVKIEGTADQTVTINDLTIDLPRHADRPTFVNKYTIDGVDGIDSSTYTFTAEQLDKLFTNGVYTITYVVNDEAAEKLGEAIDNLVEAGVDAVYDDATHTLTVNLEGTASSAMDFAMGLLDTGYGYIGVNGEALMYTTADETLELSLQTLIDAFLNDPAFTSEMLAELGKAGKGVILTAKMQLGIDSNELYYGVKSAQGEVMTLAEGEDTSLNLVLNINSMPAKVATALRSLEKVKNYVSFESDEGVLNVDLTLPEKVYEVYLTALLATEELDKNDVNAIDSAIAAQFLYDYIALVAEDETITTQTYQNTLEILDELVNKHSGYDIPNWDLTQYEEHYQILRQCYKGVTVSVNEEENRWSVNVSGKGASLLNAIKELGYDLSKYNTYINMVAELKENSENDTLNITVEGKLTNTDKDFEAVLIDVRASSDNGKVETLAKKFDYTADLSKRVKSIEGAAAIMLLSDVEGDLNFNATTVLDLNGYTVNGNITSNGKNLYIVDSRQGTYDCGTVTGTVTGNCTIIAGTYKYDVTEHLPDGYTQENGTVKNAVYYIDSETNSIVVDSSFYTEAYVNGYLPSIKALAADIAIDVATNYYGCAAMSVDGNALYDIELVNDLLCLLNGDVTGTELVNDLLDCLKPGCNDFINAVIDDLMDFAAIQAAAENGTAIATYEITTAAWAVELKHTEDDHFDIGIGSNEENGKTVSVSLVLDGENAKYVAKVAQHLDAINGLNGEESDVYVHIAKPYYENKTLYLAGSALVKVRADLTVNEKYLPVLVTALSYVLPEKAEALNAALDNEDQLKKLIDAISVEEIVNAVKTKSENVTFAEMLEYVLDKLPDDLAANLSAKLPLDSVKVEKAYDLIVKAAGKVLDKVNALTAGAVIGDLDKDNDGIYEYAKSVTKNPDITRRGYTVDALIDSVDVDIKVKLFEMCLWGDADHDGDVDNIDAMLVMQYHVGLLGDDDICTKRTDVNGDGKIDNIDAMLIMQHHVKLITKFPVEE